MAKAATSICPSKTSELAVYGEHIKRCNRGKEQRSSFVPFLVDGVTVGFMHPSFLQHLRSFPNVFTVIGRKADDQNGRPHVESFVTLHDDLKGQEDRTEAVNTYLKLLSGKGVIPGWQNELFPVINSFGATPFFSLERAAVPYFGIKAYGVHINGFSVDSDGKMYLWAARRSMTKSTFPGMLDHIVAGGQPVGLSCKENVIKECDEEAGIPREIAERAMPVSVVSYEDIEACRLHRHVLFCYDLELPFNFKPHNKDGEVDNFSLLSVEEVKIILQTSEAYKPNCVLVVIDFLFRHGYITPDEMGYLESFTSLRQGECV